MCPMPCRDPPAPTYSTAALQVILATHPGRTFVLAVRAPGCEEGAWHGYSDAQVLCCWHLWAPWSRPRSSSRDAAPILAGAGETGAQRERLRIEGGTSG